MQGSPWRGGAVASRSAPAGRGPGQRRVLGGRVHVRALLRQHAWPQADWRRGLLDARMGFQLRQQLQLGVGAETGRVLVVGHAYQKEVSQLQLNLVHTFCKCRYVSMSSNTLMSP